LGGGDAAGRRRAVHRGEADLVVAQQVRVHALPSTNVRSSAALRCFCRERMDGVRSNAGPRTCAAEDERAV
jgi:hypothetical protein